jgi:hypothetical protein
MESTMETSIDVATPNQKKLKALGFVWIGGTLFALTVINVLIYVTIFSPIPIWNSEDTFPLIAILASFALMFFLLWGALANAAHRFSTSRMENRYFRVSSDGISICVSKNDAKTIYLFKHGLRQIDLSWELIKRWYPYTVSVNLIPTSRTIVFETTQGEKIQVPTYNFIERQSRIADNIRGAIKTLRRRQADLHGNTKSSAETGSVGSKLPC